MKGLAAGGARGQTLFYLVVLTAASAAAFIATYFFWVRTKFGQRLDQDAFDGAVLGHFSRVAADDILSTISIGSLILAVAFLVLQALLRNRPTLAVTGAVIIGASVLGAETLKHFILERPDLLGPAYAIYGNSFPSGHTTIAFSIGLAATLVAPASVRRPVIALAFAYSSLIGISTIAAGWHRPSDVAGALLFTTAVASLVILIAALHDRQIFAAHRPGMQAAGEAKSESSWPKLEVPGHYVTIGATLAVIGVLVMVARQLVDRIDAIDLPALTLDFVAAASTIVALDALLIAGFLFALRRSLP